MTFRIRATIAAEPLLSGCVAGVPVSVVNHEDSPCGQKRSSIARSVAMLLGILLLSGCISGVPVTITNNSASLLTQVTVSGKDFSESAGSIQPGGTETIRVRPRRETGVKVAFEANGQHYGSSTETTIENDTVNTVAVTVAEDLSISIDMIVR